MTKCHTKYHMRRRAEHRLVSQLPVAHNARPFFEKKPGLGPERLEVYIENNVAKYTATYRSYSSNRGVE
jgi:hypothetical protein